MQQTEVGRSNTLEPNSIVPSKDRGAGMYGYTPRVQIGAFTICQQCDGMVWIEHESGEGMETPESLLEPVIAGFYKEHF